MPSGKSIKNLRILHRCLGLFFSPTIVFFAFSGGLQIFNLHKPDKSTGYVPPAWIVEMAQIHKSQTLSVPKLKTKSRKPAAERGDSRTAQNSHRFDNSRLPLQCFFLVMSAGLVATTFLGIYMAFCFGGDKRLIWAMLIAGTMLPMAMLLL